MLIWGGQRNDQAGTALSDGATYSPETDTWRPISQQGSLSPRWAANSVWTGSSLVVWGGLGCGAGRCQDGAFYDPGTDRWRRIGRQFEERIFGAAWSGSALLLWSGGAPPGWVFQPEGERWQPMAALPRQIDRRQGGHLAWTGKELLVWGGELDYLTFGDGAAYTPPR